MKRVRVGVVGLGYMGMQHAVCLHDGSVDGAALGALCDRSTTSLARAGTAFPGVPTFTSLDTLIAARACDAVLVATPHYDHPQAILAAFAAGMHVLVEKPLAVSIKAARDVVAAYAR